MTTAPAARGSSPSSRSGGHQWPARQPPVSHHGTSTAALPETKTRNRALPSAAEPLRMLPP
ncbi:hypothetical protein [Streptomyces sp. NPDC003996]